MAEEASPGNVTQKSFARAFADIQAVRLLVTVLYAEVAKLKGSPEQSQQYLDGLEQMISQIMDQSLEGTDEIDKEYNEKFRQTVRSNFSAISFLSSSK